MIPAAVDRIKTVARGRIGRAVAVRRPRRTDLPLALWDLSVGDHGHLHTRAADLVEIASTFGTPTHVVDAERLRRNAREALAPLRAGQGADIFYSYKTNPIPSVLTRLHAEGIGAEVISPYELWLALRLGVPAERIVFNGPAKSDESLRLAIRERVHLINANSSGDLARIARIAAAEQITTSVGVRLALPGTWAGQFGIDATSPDAIAAIDWARQQPFVDLTALHVHRGATIRTADDWVAHVHAVLYFCDQVRAATGWSPAVLDLGGGLACPSVAGIPDRQFRFNRALGTDVLAPDVSSAISVADASRTAVQLVSAHFDELGVPVPRCIQEPGRALTGNTQLLLTSVVDVKEDVVPTHAVLDAGMNLTDPLPHEFHQLFSASAPSAPANRPYRLAGPICTPADILYYNWRLPDLEPGHVLAIMDTGAYFVPFSTTFSFPRPPVVVLDHDGLHEERRRETFDDMLLHDDVEPRPAGEPV